MELNQEMVKTIIPHRPPMLLVDSVVSLEPEKEIVTRFHVDPDWEIFRGHFPGAPVLPGIYTVEAMGQAADVLLLRDPRYAGTKPLLIGVNNVRFRSKVRPGDTIEIHAAIASERPEKKIVTCAATVYNLTDEKKVCCTGEVTLAMR